MNSTSTEEIKADVVRRYGAKAREQSQTASVPSCCGVTPSSQAIPLPMIAAPSSDCCGPSAISLVKDGHAATLYGEDQIAALPDTVTDVALGCGNPTAIAGLNPGEVVLDLGSGGGIDCFLAAQRVGPQGRVIGVDMTPDMILLARQNTQKMGVSNVEFRLGEIEHLPIEGSAVDVIMSNCVINLSPDKDQVFREAFRVLKPGGRVSISDIVVTGELPDEVRSSLEQWAGCVAGALEKNVYLQKLEQAGFAKIAVQSSKSFGSGALEGAVARITVTAHKPS